MKTRDLFLVILFIMSYFAGNANAGCDLSKTPLERGENCATYVKEDKKLNSAYKALSKTLDKNSLPFLIKTQRRWIEWRDSRCEKAQVESGCTGVTTNSQCVGRAHDECILDLTAQRTVELRNFIENPSDASKTHFDFSLKYRYMDEE